MNRYFFPSRQFSKGISVAIITLIASLAAYVFWNLIGERKDFFDNLWGPAYLLLRGSNPYNTSSLSAELPPLWLPMGVAVFAPLGWLTEEGAAQIWFLFNIAGLALIILLSMGELAPLPAIVLTGLMAYLFPPSVNHFVLGQFSITAMLCLLLSAMCAGKVWDWPAAFLLALAMTKPQLGFLAIIGLGSHYFQRSGLQGILGFAARLILAAFILSLPVFLSHPSWMAEWLGNMQRNPAWLHPSLFTFLRIWMGVWAFPFWSLLLIAGIFACWTLWKRLPPLMAILWTLGLTTLLSPYIWSWDFVLLLPVWSYAFARAEWRQRSMLLLAYLAGGVGMAVIQLSPDNNNLLFWWIPYWFIGALVAISYPSLRSGRQPV